MTHPIIQTGESEPYTTRPTTQLDLEARREADFQTARVLTNPNETNAPYAVEGNDTSGYVGVDSDKMTYANDTERPLQGDGVEDEMAKEMYSGYGYGEVEIEAGPGQTLGSGSSQPVVHVTSSGESVKHEVVGKAAALESKDDSDGDRKATEQKGAPNSGQKAKTQSKQPPLPGSDDDKK